MSRSALVMLLAAALLSVGPAVHAQDVVEQAVVVNPHRAPDQCVLCHEAGETPTQPGKALSSIASCTACHASAAEDMHAVGLLPVESTIPPGWPLEDGVVGCATCHAEPACDASRPQEAPWHRGGPYPDLLQMCWQCHSEEGMDRQDPHHPDAVRADRDPSCSACHLGVPAVGASAADSNLIQEPEQLCDFCHEGLQHSGMASHMGVAPVEVKIAQPALFPLDGEGAIACWTCHEVHRDGDSVAVRGAPNTVARDALRARLLAEDWVGAFPADARWPRTKTERAEHTPMLVLPLADGQLCAGCHGAGP